VVAAALTVLPTYRLTAQSSRLWRPEDRTLLTDLSVVTAVAATRSLAYAATPFGLAIYDRAFARWQETVGPLDGYPTTRITAMAADPADDTVWLGGQGRYHTYQPFVRQWAEGSVPGLVDQIVFDTREPGAGAYLHTTAGWFLVRRGSLQAEAARSVPPAARRAGSLSAQEVRQRLPAFDAVRLRIERDDYLRAYRITSAASVPITNEIVLGTDGNGTFTVDPVGYAVRRLPLGLLGASAAAVTSARGQLCSAPDVRAGTPRRAIACFDEEAGSMTLFEATAGVPFLPGLAVRQLLVTERAVWAATDGGLLRADRRRGRMTRLTTQDGLPDDDVHALAAAPAVRGIWVGTARGVTLVADTGRAPVAEPPIVGVAAPALATVGDTLFVGTDAGLAVLLPGETRLLGVVGPGVLRDPIVALSVRGDSLLAATPSRFVVRAHGTWTVADVPGTPVGRITALAPDDVGWWIAGEAGLAFFDPSRGVWNALVAPGDVPLPVRGIAASRRHVWAATPAGLVRLRREVLVP
jgi:hypothetical protein